jgi:hypothetical protein
MKKIKLLLTIVFTLVFTACNSDSNPSENPDGSNKKVKDYFPGGTGSNWTYSVSISDSGNNNLTNSGTKVTTFTSVITSNGFDQIKQEEAITRNNVSVPIISVDLRRTDSGLFMIIDTTGWADKILDSLVQKLGGQVNINIDSEARILSVPFYTGQTWKVFSVSVNVLIGSFDIISITARYMGTEDIIIDGNTHTAQKIEYAVTFRIPVGNVSYNTENYKATAWYAENVGMARFEGNALLTNLLSGAEINISDTSSIGLQELTAFSINN